MSVNPLSSQSITEKQASGLSAVAAKQAEKAEQKKEKIQETSHSGLSEDKRFDTYDKTPEKSESDYSGIYHVAEEEDGTPKIIQDAPEPDAKASEADPAEKAPEAGKEPGKSEGESCTANTDQVDAEIKRLKEEKQKLEQQMSAVSDESQRARLESRLTSVEAELQSKDNDSYRKQNTNFTNS